MLAIVTGTPGAGKTLWTIREVLALQQKQGRQIYYGHIPDLQLDWLEIKDPRQWHQVCETGGIIVIDEAWKYFPAVATGSARPDYIQAFAEHRHRGLDIFLLTQHATQIDTFTRKMADRHVHLSRRYQLPRSRVYEWQSVVADPNDHFARKEAKASEFWFPKRLYGLYKSADMHTRTQGAPWSKLLLLAALVGVVAYMANRIYQRWASAGEPAPVPEAVEMGGVTAEVRPQGLRSVWEEADFRPRLAGQPGSAPAYDGLVQVRSAPMVSGCMLHEYTDGRRRCSCNDQRGVPIRGMETGQCVQLVREGWFEWWRSDSDVEARHDREVQRRQGGSGNGGL